MSGIITSLREFGHFLWSGSFNPDLEKRISSLNGQQLNVKHIIETSFKRNDYTFMDAKEVLSRLAVEVAPNSSSKKPYTGTVHQQVILKCPNLTYSTNKYKQFYDGARIGEYGIAAALTIKIAFVIFSMIRNQSIAALSGRNISLLAMGLIGCGIFWSRAHRAKTFLDSINISLSRFIDYANEVKSTRERLFWANQRYTSEIKNIITESSTKQKIVEKGIPVGKALSSGEEEISRLLKIRANLGGFLKNKLSISIFLGSCLVKVKNPLTPEVKAIKAYLLDLNTLVRGVSDWVQTTTGALKQIVGKGRWGCTQSLDKISNTFSIKNCLDQLDSDARETVIKHLKNYLDARYEGKETATLPAKNDLVKLIQPIKDKARDQIYQTVNSSYSVFFEEIKVQTHPFWKQAGLKPGSWDWAEPKSE